jgi:hypothetical protein
MSAKCQKRTFSEMCKLSAKCRHARPALPYVAITVRVDGNAGERL